MKFSRLFAFILLAIFAYQTNANCATWTVLTTNFDDNSVSSFPVTTPLSGDSNLVSDPTNSFSKPLGIVVHPDGTTAYVANNNNDILGAKLSVIDTTTNAVVSTLDISQTGPFFFALNAAGTHAYMTNIKDSSISVYDISGSNKQAPVLAGGFSTGKPATAIAISHDDKTLYTTVDNAFLHTYDISADPLAPPLASSIPLTVLGIGRIFNYIALTPASSPKQKLYISNDVFGGSVTRYDLTNRLQPTDPIEIDTGNKPDGIAINPAGEKLFITHARSGLDQNYVSVIDVDTDAHLFDFFVFGTSQPTDTVSLRDLAITSDNKTLFVLDQSANNGVFVVPLPADGTPPSAPFEFIPMGKTPLGIAITPDQAPTASFTLSSSNVSIGTPVTFNAAASSSPVGSIASYAWDFGDGTFATTSSPTIMHTYTTVGSFTVSLTVTNTGGTSSLQVFPTGRELSNNGGPSAKAAHAITVQKEATTILLSTIPNPSLVGEQVLLIVSVASDSGVPAGNVTFFDGPVALGTLPLDINGNAILTVPFTLGQHTLTASYLGNAQFNASTSLPVIQVVNKGNTTTTLSSSSNPSSLGQAITLTATVAAVSPAAGTPTGLVTFFDGNVPLGNALVDSNGQAVLTFSTLTAGSHSLSANYQGDSKFNPSAGQAITQVVNPANNTKTTLTASPNPSTQGQTVILVANVAIIPPAIGAPTGIVTFFDGSTALGSAFVDVNGNAVLAVSSFCVGSHSLSASYQGNSPFAPSTSSSVEVIVKKRRHQHSCHESGGCPCTKQIP